MKKEMKYFWVQIIVLSILCSACENGKSAPDTSFKKETDYLQKMFVARAEMIPELKLDSLKIKSDTLYTFLSDGYAKYHNPVLIRQNFAVLFQDFPHIASAPFSAVRVDYQILKKDSSGYFVFYKGKMEELKASLHLFTNPSFANVVNGVFCVHKKYPDKNLVDRFNTELNTRLVKDKVDENQFFGADYLDIVTMYLVECEKRSPGYGKHIVEKSLADLAGDTNIGYKVIKEISAIFEDNCKKIQELNPGSNKEKPKAIYL